MNRRFVVPGRPLSPPLSLRLTEKQICSRVSLWWCVSSPLTKLHCHSFPFLFQVLCSINSWQVSVKQGWSTAGSTYTSSEPPPLPHQCHCTHPCPLLLWDGGVNLQLSPCPQQITRVLLASGVAAVILRCPGVAAAPGVTPHSPSAGGGLSPEPVRTSPTVGSVGRSWLTDDRLFVSVRLGRAAAVKVTNLSKLRTSTEAWEGWGGGGEGQRHPLPQQKGTPSSLASPCRAPS